MNRDDELPPLDDDAASLLRTLQDQSVPGEIVERVRARVDATLALAAPSPDVSGTDSAAGASASASSSSAAPASASSSSVASVASSAGLHAASVKVALVAFALGVGTGVGASRLVAEAPVRVVHEVAYLPAPTPSQTADGVDEATAVVEVPSVLPDAGVGGTDAGRPDAGGATTGRRDRALSEENTLVTRAQSALARGNPGEALEALNEHQRRFPAGQFSQEREAMAIQALARLGRADAARARAATFRARFPDSVLLRTVDAVVSPSP
ncbi:outer membrane protein assembly factor BamD [Chondromyces crocatus]|uniref:Uncharacterized protein n=1 Tax=Chondromyces crocatus TaxID=52 RepID=A0A0K1EQX9_CHOCO|nr:outer membrane protein assembly factor BamD [Chondromyces crocatus]AKT43028.1 uncharacterized protein CMC5_072550 [Chondromyces crocatus]